jgi:hypothetical protein
MSGAAIKNMTTSVSDAFLNFGVSGLEIDTPEELFISNDTEWCPIVDRAPWPHVSNRY